MFVVIITSIIAFVLSYLNSREKSKYGLELGFVILTVVQAIHFEYGNDYINYEFIFEEQSSTPLFSPISMSDFKDPGWAIICRLFSPVGFFGMVAILSVVQNFIYYTLIKKYVPVSWYWFSMFVYAFSTSMFLMNLSMLRQGFVIAIFLALVPSILNKKWMVALPILAILSTIHASAILLLPFAFWGYLRIKSGKIISILYLLLFVFLFVGGDFVEDLLSLVFSLGDLSRYNNMADIGLSFGIGFLIDLIPFALTLIFLFNETESEENKKMVALSGIGSLLIPFQQYFVMVGRIGWYFSSMRIVCFYLLYRNVKDKTIRNVLILVCLLLTIYRYNLFFHDGAFAESYSQEFRTIFEVPWR